MRKTTFLAFGLMFSIASFAQNPQVDTIPTKRDSLMADLKDALLDNTPTISLDDNDAGDGGSQNISSMLTAGRDPYFSATSFNFNAARFRLRGYDNDLFSTYMNGVPMDNIDNGFTPYGQWGGLNDVMRNRDVSYGLRFNTFAFGDIGSNTNIDARASKQRKQTSLSYAISNRTYGHRLMVTHSTGMNQKGWAFSFSGSRRYANEGFVPGTYYDGWSYFAGVDKKINNNHLLSLVVFGAPTENGRQAAAVQELFDLSGSNYYNPNWGYQNGKKRNASVGKSHQPVGIFTHEWKINPTTMLMTGVSFTTGDRSVSALDWYNAPDPRPDYYRYLPSYYKNDTYQYEQLLKLFKTDESVRQINWGRIYNANYDNIRTIGNIDGDPTKFITGKRSVYVIEDRIINTKRININSTINKTVSEHLDVTGGITYQSQDNHYFKRIDDLLGGDFYMNLNQFAERDFPTNPDAAQWDLDHPNRVLKVGDDYAYNFNMKSNKLSGWGQGVFRYNKVDFFVGAEASKSSFYRVGNTRVGLFPNNSKGKGTVNDFTNFGAKGGATYKINGRNYLYINGYYGTRAPFFENVYLSPKTRSSQQSDLKSETIQSLEGGYTMNAPNLKVHLSGYYTTIKDQMDMMSFYSESYQSFVNYSLSGINKSYTGIEAGVEVKLTPTWTMNAAAAVGKYLYTNRPYAVTTYDNRDSVTDKEKIYFENYRLGSPQQAYSIGFSYRSPKFWFISLTGNYFDESWISPNPLRRTYKAVYGLDSLQRQETLAQEKADPQFTLDFFGGWSKKLSKKYEIAKGRSTFLVFNVGVNNILNNKDMVTGGYEQLRYDAVGHNTSKFPSKYYYGYGLNYFLSATLRF